MGKQANTEVTESTESNGKMTQGQANKEAALIGFQILHNGGKAWPTQLYQDADGNDLSDAEKVKRHKGYEKMLIGLAKKAGKAPRVTTTVAFD
jgi:hypothetical protein